MSSFFKLKYPKIEIKFNRNNCILKEEVIAL